MSVSKENQAQIKLLVITNSAWGDSFLRVAAKRQLDLEGHKNEKKSLKSLKNGECSLVIWDTDEGVEKIDSFAQEVKALNQNNQLMIVQKDPVRSDSVLIDAQGVDYLCSREQDNSDILQRIVDMSGITIMKPPEGKSKALAEKLISECESMKKIGDYFDVLEGMTMERPDLQLKENRSHDDEVIFLKNGQIKAFVNEGRPAFWRPNLDAVLANPADSVMADEVKLLMHAYAPPIKAAINREGIYFGRSYYQLQPLENCPASLEDISALLNSRVYDFYLHKLFIPQRESGRASSFLRSVDIKQFPLPEALLERNKPKVKDEVLELEMLLHSGAGNRHDRVQELRGVIDDLLFDLFQFDENHRRDFKKLHF
ncbi:MAG: hypothetical protein HQL32_05700 [Planctomycetes bacterium]|nr:hypothetical protein [Planctomycetota bacterium]